MDRRHHRKPTLIWLVAAGMASGALAAGGCGGAGRAAGPVAEVPGRSRPVEMGTEVGAVIPAVSQLAVVPGRRVFVPVVPAASEGAGAEGTRPAWTWRPPRGLDAALIVAEPVRSPAALASWLPSSRLRWSAVRPEAGRVPSGAAAAYWVVAVSPPPDFGRRPLEVPVGAGSLRLIPLPPPPERRLDPSPPRPGASENARRGLGLLLEQAALDPFERWRARLAGERYSEAELGRAVPASLADPVLDGLARQLEDQWRAGLAELGRADEAVALDVLRTLTAVVRLPGGNLRPVWPPDDGETSLLLRTLVDPAATPERRVQAAQAWLAHAPAAVAWPIDDAGVGVGAAGAAQRLHIGVADLRGRATTASAAEAGATAGNPTPLPAHDSVLLATDINAGRGDGLANVVARAGDWRTQITVLGSAVRARPPGLLMSPMLPVWTMRSWLAGEPEVPVPGEAAAALLQPAAGGPGGRWELFVECRSVAGEGEPPAGPPAPGAAEGPADAVRVYIGPFAESRAILRVDRSGRVADESRPGSPVVANAVVSDEKGLWTAVVPIPVELVDNPATAPSLLMGLSRTDARGVRYTWPRPLMPGQLEPGRVRVDLAGWSR
ncbi:MAG: hypothetical protein IBJ11_02590 [Phycisphaerales bacterium]|nr:hypothetical protein [Phycisphaerales bacterium]